MQSWRSNTARKPPKPKKVSWLFFWLIAAVSASGVYALLGPQDWRPVLARLTAPAPSEPSRDEQSHDKQKSGDKPAPAPSEPTPAPTAEVPIEADDGPIFPGIAEAATAERETDPEAEAPSGPAFGRPRTPAQFVSNTPPPPEEVQREPQARLFAPPQEREESPDSPPAGDQQLREQIRKQIRGLSIDRVTRSTAEQKIFSDRYPVKLTLHDLLAQTLLHSKAVQALRVLPAEELQEVNREFGQFDWRGFVDSQFSKDNQPVGDSLQVTDGSGLAQVRNEEHQATFGLRKDTRSGGSFEVSESLGLRDSNSGLLTPEDQGTAAFRITFSQELLRDGGRDVVLSRALIARYNADQIHADAHAQISDRLRDVLTAYWALYEARGTYFIQASLIELADETLRSLEAREDLDAERNSLEQARALALEARADLANARAGVLIAQDELYRLVNAPGIDPERIEILTGEPPQTAAQLFTLDDQLPDALANRAEIVQSLSDIREAALEHHVSLNQLLPRLTLSLEGSLNGIEGDFNSFDARGNVTDTNPSYQVGLNFEYFLGNRTARAQNRRAQFALRRLQLQYEDQIEEVRLDVSRSIRTLNASTEILDQRRQTLSARQQEINYLQVRRFVAPQEGTPASLLIEQQFQAINRLIDSQRAYLAALSGQQTAMAELLRAKGLLLSPADPPTDLPTAEPTVRKALRTWRRDQKSYTDEARENVIRPAGAFALPTLP